MSVSGAELYSTRSTNSKVVYLSMENQATASTCPGYSYPAPLLHYIRRAANSLPFSGSTTWVE